MKNEKTIFKFYIIYNEFKVQVWKWSEVPDSESLVQQRGVVSLILVWRSKKSDISKLLTDLYSHWVNGAKIREM